MKLDYETTYKIKPLSWEERQIEDSYDKSATTRTIFGSMYIEKEYGDYRWSYCFDEFYDEGDHPCKSLEDGKQKAEEFYLSRLKDALIEL